MFLNTGVVAVDGGLAAADGGTGTGTSGCRTTNACLLACIGAGVLQACNIEVAADVGNDLFTSGCCAFEVGIAA